MEQANLLSKKTGPLPLMDRYDRAHRSLRISVTDVCNIRCQYCMPAGQVSFLPNDRHLSFTQIRRVAAACAALGINDFRITGGEPLMRPDLHKLFELLQGIGELQQLALTTNGMLLSEQLPSLIAAGLRRVNISLDTLNDAVFQQLTRRSGLNRVLEGIEAALARAELTVRLNALILRDVNLDDVVTLVQFAQQRKITLRFIEFMPLDGSRNWSSQRMVSGQELRQILSSKLGRLQLVPSDTPSQPSTDYQFDDGTRVGFIDSVTRPFCDRCDRLRLTSDGRLRNCLFGSREWDINPLLQSYVDDEEFGKQFELLIRECVESKAAAHGIDQPSFQPPARAMYQIGG